MTKLDDVSYKAPELLRPDDDDVTQDADVKQEQHGVSPAIQDDPFPPQSQRTRVAGLFQQLALWLDEAGRAAQVDQPINALRDALANSAKVCVELSHAVLDDRR